MTESDTDKDLLWLVETVRTPPLTTEARIEAGVLLRRLQQGDSIGMPHSRPMPSIGKRCHELRIRDKNVTWRIVYRIDQDAIVIVDWFDKKTRSTRQSLIAVCKKRLAAYDEISLKAAKLK